MKKYVYAVRDARVGFLNPIIEDSDAVAIRAFEHSMSEVTSLAYSFPSDFDFFRLATYDTETGMFSEDVPMLLTSGMSVHLARSKEVSRNDVQNSI